MQLAAYLEREKISDSEFANRIGVSRQAVHRYKSGDRFPERPVLAGISEATGGAVTANDFVGSAADVSDSAQHERAGS